MLMLFGIPMLFCLQALAASNNECPNDVEAGTHGNLGSRYWEGHRLELAERETREAIRREPDCSMWHQNLGFILESQGKENEASESWRKSLAVDKYWCTAFKTGSLMKLGWYCFKRRDFASSVDYLQKAVSVALKEGVEKPTLSTIYLHLSYNYSEHDSPFYDLHEAERLKKKALELNPNDLFIQTSIVKVLVQQKRFSEARRGIANIVIAQQKSSAPNAGVYSYLAHIYSLLHDPKNSSLYMEKAIDLDPGQATYLLEQLNSDFVEVSSSQEMRTVIAKARKLKREGLTSR